ncbi:hypothetical protein V0288_11140 [Pannus brasiliensis CCIBt3594]|uniref:ASCH domain-containing protein n=1 Tax=Pannus brasiliensis CCIBt3594 TaxID=1427578 RepID=A0AAW9QRK9_9CHRO
MKALSVIGGWAWAIAYNLKHNETRKQNINYRGKLLICAGKKHTKQLHEIYRDLYLAFPDKLSFLNYIGIESQPLGHAIAVVTLADCVPVESIENQLSEMELALGDYSEGRFAWMLTDIKRIEPFPVVGQLGLFDVPDHLIKIREAT